MKAVERRKQVLGALSQLSADYGYPPTIRELAEHVGCSTSLVVQHLEMLRACEIVDWEDGKGRTLRLLKKEART